MPKPPLGVNKCTASPASQARPVPKRSATKNCPPSGRVCNELDRDVAADAGAKRRGDHRLIGDLIRPFGLVVNRNSLLPSTATMLARISVLTTQYCQQRVRATAGMSGARM